jgi:hypothetical protein
VYIMADYVKKLHYLDTTLFKLERRTFIRMAPSLAEDSEYMISAKTTGCQNLKRGHSEERVMDQVRTRLRKIVVKTI